MGTANTIIGILAGIVTIITGLIAIFKFLPPRSKRDNLQPPPTPPVGPPVKVVAPVLGVTEITNSDAAYQDWLAKHPSGYVVNTLRGTPSNNMILHRASCSHVKNFDARSAGAFTERDYVKICADSVDSLRAWTKAHGRADGSFSGECSICKPNLTA